MLTGIFVTIYLNTKKQLEIEKDPEIVREVALRRTNTFLRKSADRKAQIREAFVRLSGLKEIVKLCSSSPFVL